MSIIRPTRMTIAPGAAIAATQERKTGKPSPSLVEGSSVALSKEGKLLGIMSKYDVRNMSYNENVKMADELRKHGLVSEEDYLDMTAPPVDFNRITGQARPDWNAPRDIVSDYEANLEFMKSTGQEEKSVAFIEHLLGIYKQLGAFHSSA